MNAPTEQLDLPIPALAEPVLGPPPELPDYALSEESTPADLVNWWEEMVTTFQSLWDDANMRVTAIDEEFAILRGQRTLEARCRSAQLKELRYELLSRAETLEYEAYGKFEATLEAFRPRVIAMLRAASVNVSENQEIAAAHFWGCLERPDIDYCGHWSLARIAASRADEST